MYNETYDDYIRSILGYPPARGYEDNYQDYRNQNMSMNYNRHTERELTLNTKGLYPTKV